jgi:MFS family permease
MLASANAGCLLLSLGLARLIDSRRPLPYVVWPGFAARGLFLLVPLINSPWPFLAVIATATLFGTLAGPAQTALVQQVYPAAERGRALGTMRAVGAVFGIVLATVSGPLMGRLGYRWVFCGAGVLGMVASLRQRRLPVPAAPATARAERSSLREAWRALRRDDGYRRVLLGSFVFGSGIWMMMPATPLVLADVVGVTTAQIGVLAAVASVAALGGNIVWGRLVDRRSSLAALRAVYLVGIATPLAYYAIQVVARNPWSLAVTSVSEALMATGLDLVWTTVVIDFAGPHRAAQYAAISGTLAGVRGILAPLLGAAIIQWWGLHAVYLVAANLMLFGAWLVTRQLRHTTTRRAGLVTHRAAG